MNLGFMDDVTFWQLRLQLFNGVVADAALQGPRSKKFCHRDVEIPELCQLC